MTRRARYLVWRREPWPHGRHLLPALLALRCSLALGVGIAIVVVGLSTIRSLRHRARLSARARLTALLRFRARFTWGLLVALGFALGHAQGSASDMPACGPEDSGEGRRPLANVERLQERGQAGCGAALAWCDACHDPCSRTPPRRRHSPNRTHQQSILGRRAPPNAIRTSTRRAPPSTIRQPLPPTPLSNRQRSKSRRALTRRRAIPS